MHINKERIEKNIEELATFGKAKEGGMLRNFGTEADIQARKWLLDLWSEKLELDVKIDPIANLWATWEGKEQLPAIVMGSHHDSVTNGGKYDGALGVLLAVEVMMTLQENNYKLRHPFTLVSFTAEEPNAFNISTMGSRVVSGKLGREQIINARDEEANISLPEALAKVGGNSEKLSEALIDKNKFAAFIECHIEQGRKLVDRNLSVGVVTSITGIYREKIKVIGEANHAGTTLMEYRHDALLAAAEFSLAAEEIVKAVRRDDVVATVGKFDVKPNSANIIPGEVELIFELRTSDKNIKCGIIEKITEEIERIEKNRGVSFEREIILNQAEINMHETVKNALKESAEKLNEKTIDIVSMAGHDAVHMAGLMPTGMLFVQSIDGKSHCPQEKTNIEDIEKAGNVLLNSILILDRELD